MNFRFLQQPAAVLLAFSTIALAAVAGAQSTNPSGAKTVPVTFSGGYETVPVDHGRPVILIASALNVAPEVFRDAFSHVKPAGPGQEPEEHQVRQNKHELMQRLEPLGVTDQRLNEVSNYYRYNHSKGEIWRNTPATAEATVENGRVTGIKITNPGSGYSSTPTVSVPGVTNVKATVTLNYGTDFATNGSIKEIKLGDTK